MCRYGSLINIDPSVQLWELTRVVKVHAQITTQRHDENKVILWGCQFSPSQNYHYIISSSCIFLVKLRLSKFVDKTMYWHFTSLRLFVCTFSGWGGWRLCLAQWCDLLYSHSPVDPQVTVCSDHYIRSCHHRFFFLERRFEPDSFC